MRGIGTLSSFLIGGCILAGCGMIPAATSPNEIQQTPALSPRSERTVTVAIKTLTPVAPPPTQTLNSAEVTFRWDLGTIITDVDDVTELAVRLRDRSGIIGAYGDEIQITVVYDPQQTAPEKIERVLADLGFPVKKP